MWMTEMLYFSANWRNQELKENGNRDDDQKKHAISARPIEPH